MPRPGPRPYECVRRAWHSDRHQPMRGSIIQQIFRVVYETHSPATKQNKEWQEKLPIVVLKAEEIMYSKANSEAEYLNLETLWDRVNDAVNTIIRRDESIESGELLPPCIEAALNLGCIPVRASRSQRHSNPRSYLSPRPQEHSSAPSRILDGTNDKRCPQLATLHPVNQLNFARGAVAMNSTLAAESIQQVTENSNISSHSYPYMYENTPGCNQLTTNETRAQLNMGSVYPLYYGNECQTKEPHVVPQVPDKMNTIFVGKPVGTSLVEPGETGALENLFSYSSAEIASKRFIQAEFGNSHDKPSGSQCHLSLRLAPLSKPNIRVEESLVQDTEDVDSTVSQGRGNFNNFLRQEEFYFFPEQGSNNLFGSCSSKWPPEGKDRNFEATMRKRKVSLSENVEDGQCCWGEEFPRNQFFGQIEGPDL